MEQQSTPQLSEGAVYTSSHFLSNKEHNIREKANKNNCTVATWSLQTFFFGRQLYLWCHINFPSFSQGIV